MRLEYWFFQLFRECDRKGKGYLDREDIKVASIRLYGLKMDKVRLRNAIIMKRFFVF